MTDPDPKTTCTTNPSSSATPTCMCCVCVQWREMIAKRRLAKDRKMANKWGRFIGPIRVEWLEDSRHRDMKILETAVYIDRRGREWRVLEGDIINGAGRHWRSNILLRLACALVPKFVGRHRIPSVFHDVYCGTRTRPSPEVHRMFYECLRCKGAVLFPDRDRGWKGVTAWITWLCARLIWPTEAWIMWAAVRVFGPRF